MNNITFINRVQKYFKYIESEFGFNMTNASNSEIRPQTDGVVRYQTASTIVLVDSETGYVTVRLARVADGEKYYLTPIDIHEYLNTSEDEKNILLSTDPRNEPAASALFNEKFLLNHPDWKGSRGTIQDLEKELSNFSSWLQQHANICLKGDFSRWTEFYEYKIYRTRADYLRRGKDEIGYARMKDTDGNWKLIKQSIFKDKIEYVEKLKKELSK